MKDTAHLDKGLDPHTKDTARLVEGQDLQLKVDTDPDLMKEKEGHQVQEGGHQVQEEGHQVQEGGHQVQEGGHQVHDREHYVQNEGRLKQKVLYQKDMILQVHLLGKKDQQRLIKRLIKNSSRE